MQNFPKPQPSRARQRLISFRALQHRSAPNRPEQLLWQALAAGRLGVYFRRQVPVGGRYIAYMLAPAIRLVVEVDGKNHAGRRGADARRDERFRRLGYRVLRIDAELVLRDLPAAVGRIREAVEQLRR